MPKYFASCEKTHHWLMYYMILQVSNVIFIDSPVGSGFSYATSEEGFISSDTMAVKKLVIFLKKVRIQLQFHTLPVVCEKSTWEVFC